jgi:hypothetical protein
MFTIHTAVNLITKETVDKYAEMNNGYFACMLALAMGYPNGGSDFIRRGDDEYALGWFDDEGERNWVKLTYADVKWYLKDKTLTLIMDVHTRT